MRKKIVDQLAQGSSPEQAARARTLIKGKKNLIDELIAIGFSPGTVLEACAQVLSIPPAPAHWLRNPKPPLVEGIDVALCREIGAAPLASTSGRLCIAYADPEKAAQHATLGFPPHQPYLAVSTSLAKALALLAEDDGDTPAEPVARPKPAARAPGDFDDFDDATVAIDAIGGISLEKPRAEPPPAPRAAAPRAPAPAPAPVPAPAPRERSAALGSQRLEGVVPVVAVASPLEARPPAEGMIGRDAPSRPLRSMPSGDPLPGPLDETRKRPAAPRPLDEDSLDPPVAPPLRARARELDDGGLDAPVAPVLQARAPERARPPPEESVERPRRTDERGPMRPQGRGFQVMSAADAPPLPEQSPARSPSAIESSLSSLNRRPPTRSFEPLDPVVEPERPPPAKKSVAIESTAPPRRASAAAPGKLVVSPRPGLGRVPLAAAVAVAVVVVALVIATRGPTGDAAATDGVSVQQRAITAEGVAEPDHAKAVVSFDRAIELDASGPGARDAYLGRARRSLALGDLEATESDLRLLKRRSDIGPIEEEIETLLNRLKHAREQR